MQLGDEHGTGRARFGRRKLSAKTDHAVAEPDLDREREIRKFPGPKRQIWNDALQRALEIEQIEAAISLGTPISLPGDVSPQQNAEMAFFFARWRNESAANFENR